MDTVAGWRPQRLCTRLQTCTHACPVRPYGMNQSLPHSSKTNAFSTIFSSVFVEWCSVLRTTYSDSPL